MTLTVFEGLLIIAQLLTVWAIYRQLRIQNKTSALDTALRLFHQNIDEKYYDTVRYLYDEFYSGGYKSLRIIKDEMKANVLLLLRTFSHIGVLYQENAIDKNMTMTFVGRAVCSAWIMLEDYIKEEREKRLHFEWHWPVEYLALEGFRYLVKNNHLLALCVDKEQARIYNQNELRIILNKLEDELKVIKRLPD